ncbi:MAG: hypothetical protein RL354_470 [Planctomycetota bacterium]|jgi:RND family efflux transporter MFP subunit
MSTDSTMPSRPAAARPRVRLFTRALVPGAILGAAALLIAVSAWRAFERVPTVRVAPVVVVASQSAGEGGSGGIQAPGWIEPAPFATEIRAFREGIVTEVLVLEGSRVGAGETLVLLDSSAERIELAREEASLALAEATLAAKRANESAAERTLTLALDAEGAVREAEALLREAEAARAKLASLVAQAEAREAELRDEHERKHALVEAGAASAGDVRRLALRVSALAAETESLRQERPAREARVAAATGALESARKARVELVAETRARDEARAETAAAMAARDVAAAARDAAALAVERGAVRAPRDGIVMRRSVTPGAKVGGDTGALLALYDPASLQVRCDVPLKEAATLAVGLEAEIHVDALPNRTFAGRVVRIVPEGDLQKNTVQCKVEIASPDPALRPDMLARVRILTDSSGRQGEAIAVPEDSLRDRDGARATVLLAIPEAGSTRTVAREITLGPSRDNGWIEVAAGLSGGDRIVLEPSVTEGVRISPIETPKADAP